MACINSTGYSIGCMDWIGGVNKVYIRNWSGSTVYTANSTGSYTGCTNTTTPWYTFEQVSEVADFNAGEGEHSSDNGTHLYKPTVNLVFHKYQASLRTIVSTLAKKEVEIIVLDNNGNYFLVGETRGAKVVGSSAPIGKTLNDLHGATISFQAKEAAQCPQVSSTLVSTFTLA
jgi:hypothetical protein